MTTKRKREILFRAVFVLFAACLVTAGIAYNLERLWVFIAASAGVLVSAEALIKLNKQNE